MTPDAELLRAYAKDRSEPAFAELVRRHVNLVYSVALRNLAGDTQLAEDVTQQVFTDLAQKAGALSRHAVLGGWLYRSTQFAAAKTVRSERRRRIREQEAEAMHASTASTHSEPDWEKLRPTLDRLIGELDERDRDAVWLRFVANQSYADIGTKLGLSENAARMRVDRALAKLHQRLSRAGITSSLSALGTALAGQARSIAPAGLAGAVMETIATAPAAGVSFLGVSLAANLALFFAGGLALGGAAAWALPESAISGQEPTMTAKVLWSSGITPAVTRLRALTSPSPALPPANAAALPPEVDRILREAGLHAASRDSGPAPSWLYVGAPMTSLLKSKEYIELSITAFEGQVDAACVPLFLQLNLAPEAADQLRRTLAEMLHARVEANALALARDLKPSRAELIGLVDASDAEYTRKIRMQLGDTRFTQFEDYFDRLPVREFLGRFFEEMALRTGSPLTPAQWEGIVASFYADTLGETPPAISGGMFSDQQFAIYSVWRGQNLPGWKQLQEDQRLWAEMDPGILRNRPIYRRTGSPGLKP